MSYSHKQRVPKGVLTAFGAVGGVATIRTPGLIKPLLGATMAGVIAAQGGWNVIYLGPNVPIEEIAFCADCKDARAVGISISYPLEDPRVSPLLRELKLKLQPDCHLLVGGAAAHRYRDTLQDIGAWESEDLGQLAAQLNHLR